MKQLKIFGKKMNIWLVITILISVMILVRYVGAKSFGDSSRAYDFFSSGIFAEMDNLMKVILLIILGPFILMIGLQLLMSIINMMVGMMRPQRY
jgi:hypothetical protein